MERINFDRSAHKGELKTFSVSLSADPTSRQVKGYAAVWGVIGSQPGEYAVFPSGSCVLPPYPVVLQYNHDSSWQLATEDNGTLALTSDDKGLGIVAQLDETFLEDFLVVKLSKGTIRGMSLGMYPIKTHKEPRTVTEADALGNPELRPLVGSTVTTTVYDKWLLDEVTITGKPVFPQTSIGTFSRDEKESVSTYANYEEEARLRGLMLD